MNKKTKLIQVIIVISLLFGTIHNIFAVSKNIIQFSVKGEIRQALVCYPASDKNGVSPLIIAFHGHGGSMQRADKEFNCEAFWPESVVIYPQGLKTPGTLLDKKGKFSGWQSAIGMEHDRDLFFF